ncbi:hypothetical protein BS47DRAFT_1292706, partial [Hydnum rufescens UP504]
MWQRRSTALHTKLKTSRSNFQSIASDLASVSESAIEAVLDRVSHGDHATANSNEERTVLKLMREVSLISAKVPGSAASHTTMCNEIRGLMFDLGLPCFYLTINPADVYNPLV